ncbi:MAG: glycosyltransferase family 2 protein [Patescibacteria group bacterium]|nr:glycosyltransferase family 2 protein [Patescibacteria group bacterium]
MLPKVFIIILNWNNWTDTKECLKSLENNGYPNCEVVVVDNGSDKKQKITNPKIKVIYNKENLGFSGGNNIGIKYALKNNADYVLLLNNDTIVNGDFLEKLVKAGESDAKIGFLGPKIYFADATKEIWFAGGEINWLYNKGTMRGYSEIDKGQYDSPEIQDTEYITGCCLLVKSKTIKKIGLMPDKYFLYYEDADWSLRAQTSGFRTVFVSSAQIQHKCSRSSIEGSPSYIYYHSRNGLILAREYAPWFVLPLVHLDAFWRIAKQLVKLIFFPKKRVWAKSVLLGIRDFYSGKKERLIFN